ncbi:2-hydroxyacid dehydrogenase [Paenibacillus sepulcri]|uniref:D-glycerate dehydrogenase n=1 Tax=Paenibacillus sepulcri TaxID=359917 RepID=A0ABS7C1H5_9BACL|nr:D-glycerate dehydrogenase [Paenibacillus sepulcri]
MEIRKKIVITRKLPDPIIQELDERNYRIHMWPSEDDPMPYDKIVKEAAEADALLTNVSDQIDKQVLSAGAKLKIVSTMAVGYNNIDIQEASKRGIYVGHTPDVLTEAVADLTFALLLAVSRKIVEGMAFIKADRWNSWGPMLLTGQDVWGSTLGIIGMGRIGEAVSRRAAGFGMNILYCNRNRKPQAEQQLGVAYAELDDLLTKSDFVVMLAPSTPATHRMLGEREFHLMKPNAVFINTSRGENVDEAALFHALKNKRIWGAGLDVFEQEPITSRHRLFGLENVTLLPHIGSATIATRLKMAGIAVQNIKAVLSGGKPAHCVNEF